MTSRLLILTVTTALLITNIGFAEQAKLTAEQQRSYALGVETAKSFQSHNINIDLNAYMEAMRDIQTQAPLKMTDAAITQALMNLQKEQATQYTKSRDASAQKNQLASEAYLKANAVKPGIHTLDNGIQYQIITEGKGAKPSDTDTVTVNYEGKLINGAVFDSSYKRGQPATFPLNGVIPGWQQSLTHMPVGSTWVITIPASLAYGEQGTPDGSIGPNQALIFKVELIKIDN